MEKIADRAAAGLVASDDDARYRALFETAADAIVVIDETGTITAFNPAAERIFGHPATDVLWRNLSLLLPEPETGAPDSSLADDVRTGDARIIGTGREVEGRRRDGSTLPLELSIAGHRVEGRQYFTCIMRDVAERKAADDECQRLLAERQAILDSMAQGLAAFDRDGRVIYRNATARALFGVEADEELPFYHSLGARLTVRHPGGPPLAPAEFPGARALAGEPVRGLEMAITRGDGRELILRCDGVPQVEAGHIVGAIVTVTDITAQRQTETALRESEHQLKLITDTLPVLISYVDADQRYRFNNRGYEAWFGHAPDALRGRHMRDVLGEDAYRVLLPHIEAVLAGERVTYEALAPYAQGGARHITATYVPDFGPDGGVRGFYALIADDSERSKAAAALDESRQRMADITANVPGLVYRRVLRPDGRLEHPYVSGGVEEIYGCSVADFQALHSLDALLALIHPEDRARWRTTLQQSIDTLSRFDVEARTTPQEGGIRWVRSMATVRRGSDGAVYWDGVSLDITETKRLEEHQQLLMAELDHRVKNILAVAQALARQSLTGGPGDTAAFVERLSALSTAHHLLADGKWSGAEVGAVVAAALSAYRSTDGARCATRGPPVHLPAKAVQSLGLALHELATNAAKYGALSAPDGSVEVHWQVLAGSQPRLRLEWTERGGPPVKPPARKGFGTRFVERTLAYELDGEATMTFDEDGVRSLLALPLPHGAAPPAGRPAPALPVRPQPLADASAAPRQPGLLLVEDEALIAMGLESVLNEAGLTVLGPVGRLGQAIELARSAPHIDVAVLDVNLAGEEVWPAAELLRQRRVPVLLLTGYDASALPAAWRDTPRLSKPVHEGTLLAEVRRLLPAD